MKKLAIITTHPIQYNAPLFKMLHQRGHIELKVFYTWEQSNAEVYDPTFGHTRKWDIPLLEGYNFTFVKNISKLPGSHHFKGIVNPTLEDEIKQFSPNAILVYGWAFQSHLKVMRYFKGKIPIWFRGDSTLLDETPGINFKKIARRILLSWVYKHVDVAFYVGERNKEYFLKHGLKNNQLVFAPHAVDNARFRRAKIELDIKTIIKAEQNDIVIAYAGKFYNVKNLHFLIEVFKHVDIKQLKLVLIGNGILEEELKQLASAVQNIHFLPFMNQSQMPSVYKTIDYFILPSKSETWGLGVNEAMACNTPCIVSNKVGCASDLIEPNKTGYIFNFEDEDSLAKILLNIAQTHQYTIDDMKASIRQYINQFTYEKICEAIETK